MKTIVIHFNLVVLILLISIPVYAQDIRPIRDDVGYCWQGDQFNLFIKWLDKNCPDEKIESKNLIAGISPHDDYLYAGKVYYPLYKLIKAKEVVIFGVTHGTVRKEIDDPKNIIILDDFDKWKGPYNDVAISSLRDKLIQKLDAQNYIVSKKAHSLEHSIEGLIPFLQHYNIDARITPIMVTAMSFDKMDSLSAQVAEIILDYVKENNLKLNEDIFFLISNDANHYGEDFDNHPYGMDEMAHSVATANDQRIIGQDINGVVSKEKLKSLSNELWPEAGYRNDCPLWCGKYSVVFGLLTVNKVVNKSGKIMLGKMFKYSDTWTEGVLRVKGTKMGITAPYSLKHWCGFFSAGFYLE
jgi:AmmeMemoRadiSam system protein B